MSTNVIIIFYVKLLVTRNISGNRFLVFPTNVIKREMIYMSIIAVQLLNCIAVWNVNFYFNSQTTIVPKPADYKFINRSTISTLHNKWISVVLACKPPAHPRAAQNYPAPHLHYEHVQELRYLRPELAQRCRFSTGSGLNVCVQYNAYNSNFFRFSAKCYIKICHQIMRYNNRS